MCERSLARLGWIGRKHSYVGLYEQLVTEGLLSVDIGGRVRVFTRDRALLSMALAQWQESAFFDAAETTDLVEPCGSQLLWREVDPEIPDSFWVRVNVPTTQDVEHVLLTGLTEGQTVKSHISLHPVVSV